MQDLWRVRDYRAAMSNLDDAVEYHRFLKRFKADEEERRLRDVLYAGQRFRTLAGEDKSD